MPAAELLRMLRAQPFTAFRIHLGEGTVYDIRHPELVLVGTGSAVVAFPHPEHPGMYQSWEILDLRHIVRLERIEPASQVG